MRPLVSARAPLVVMRARWTGSGFRCLGRRVDLSRVCPAPFQSLPLGALQRPAPPGHPRLRPRGCRACGKGDASRCSAGSRSARACSPPLASARARVAGMRARWTGSGFRCLGRRVDRHVRARAPFQTLPEWRSLHLQPSTCGATPLLHLEPVAPPLPAAGWQPQEPSSSPPADLADAPRRRVCVLGIPLGACGQLWPPDDALGPQGARQLHAPHPLSLPLPQLPSLAQAPPRPSRPPTVSAGAARPQMLSLSCLLSALTCLFRCLLSLLRCCLRITHCNPCVGSHLSCFGCFLIGFSGIDGPSCSPLLCVRCLRFRRLPSCHLLRRKDMRRLCLRLCFFLRCARQEAHDGTL